MDPRAAYFLILTDQQRQRSELAREHEFQEGRRSSGAGDDDPGPGLIGRLRGRMGSLGSERLPGRPARREVSKARL
jgi:hypothetical protein